MVENENQIVFLLQQRYSLKSIFQVYWDHWLWPGGVPQGSFAKVCCSLIICIFHVLPAFDKVIDMTETKVDAVLNFARNVFVDTALKVRGQLIVIIVIIMNIIKVSKLIKIVIFLILQCRTILDISSQKILESSTPPQQVNIFQMLWLTNVFGWQW